jgi:hypothetical protein
MGQMIYQSLGGAATGNWASGLPGERPTRLIRGGTGDLVPGALPGAGHPAVYNRLPDKHDKEDP